MPQSQTILNDIKQIISKDKDKIKKMSLAELAAYIHSTQQTLGEQHGVSGEIRQVDTAALEVLLENAKIPGTKLVFRHGEQDFNEKGLSAAQKKIVMMQLEHNKTDPITSLSAIEFFSTAAILVKMNSNIAVQSSSNLRAKQPAETLANVLDTQVKYLPELDCMNYPDEPEFSQRKLEALLVEGALPWKKEIVDEVGGPGTCDGFVSFAEKFVAAKAESDVLAMISHTQQTNAICEALKLPILRFASFGFVFISAQTNLNKVYENGFYSTQKLQLNGINVSEKGKEITVAFDKEKTENNIGTLPSTHVQPPSASTTKASPSKHF